MAGVFAFLWAVRMRIISIESPNLPYYPNAYVQEYIIEDKICQKLYFFTNSTEQLTSKPYFILRLHKF